MFNRLVITINILFSVTCFAQPIEYFTFASEASIVLKQDLKKIANEVNGNMMLGGDASYPTVSSEFIQVMRRADSFGAKKHVYLEGPGGPTGSSGIAGDECQRMLARAKLIGMKIDKNNCSSSAAWMKKWNATGWWTSAQSEIKYFYDNYGATSFEIDNLYRAGIESTAAVIKFIRQFQIAMDALNIPATLMLKNLTVSDLQMIKNEIDKGTISRDGLTDFMISEEDFKGSWPSIGKASKKIGIKMLQSRNTYDYQARGYWSK